MEMDLEPGTLIDNRYVVEAEIGRGGMAAVYRVRHVTLGTLAAMKVLTMPATSIQKRLMHEGRVQAALQHPNIVAVSDVVVHAGAPALVMEYVRGPSLDDFLERRRVTIPQADELAQGILEGVAAAHRHGLIHRDLKPANIMLAITDSGVVPKVTDFGLVKMLMGDGDSSSKTRSGVAMGTPSYMAPEQISDAKSVDTRADIFSLGAILYELLSNQRTFDNEDMFQVFSAIVGGQYTPIRELVPDIPERMELAIEGALTPDREARFPDVKTLLAVWMGHGDGAATGAWEADLLKEVSQMGAGGESTGESLRRSLKGGLPQSRPTIPNQRETHKTGGTFLPHPADVNKDIAEPSPKTQSTMAPIPGMYDEPFPESVQQPPAPAAGSTPATPNVPAAPAPSALPIATVAGVGVVVLLLALGGGAGLAYATGMFATAGPVELPVPDPLPVPATPEPPLPEPEPEPTTPDPEPTAPEPEPTAPDPEPTTPEPTRPEPVAPAPEPEPVAPDPEPVEEPRPEPVDPTTVEPEPVPEPPPPPKPPFISVHSPGMTVHLLNGHGDVVPRSKIGEGSYRLIAYYKDGVPTEVGTYSFRDGETWQINCSSATFSCVVTPR